MDVEVLVKQKYGFSVFEKSTIHQDGKRSRPVYEIRDANNQLVESFQHISLVYRHLEEELSIPIT